MPHIPEHADEVRADTANGLTGTTVQDQIDELAAATVTDGAIVEAGTVEGGTVVWRWGIDAQGRPYFDDVDGADLGQEAQLLVDAGDYYVEEVPL